jgi:hypothetical protein
MEGLRIIIFSFFQSLKNKNSAYQISIEIFHHSKILNLISKKYPNKYAKLIFKYAIDIQPNNANSTKFTTIYFNFILI